MNVQHPSNFNFKIFVVRVLGSGSCAHGWRLLTIAPWSWCVTHRHITRSSLSWWPWRGTV